MRTQPGPGGRGAYTPHTEHPTAPGLHFFWGGTLHSTPLSVAQGALPPPPSGARELHPNPRARVWGGGREEEGAAPLTETQRDVLQPRLHGDAGGGASTHPILPFPPAGLAASATTHLGPAYLGWGRGDAAAGGLGAVSVFVSPARGGSGLHNHGLGGMRRRREGLSCPRPGAPGGGVPEASCW